MPLFLVTMGNFDAASTIDESVDLIELNHFHDEKGLPVYDQIIFYQWSDSQGKFHVRAWCLIEPKEVVSRRPILTSHDNRHHVRWFDNDQKIDRHLSSSLYKETWTQTDPERANKKILDERNRVALYRKPDKNVAASNKEIAPATEDVALRQ
jgi:hypothetical protein